MNPIAGQVVYRPPTPEDLPFIMANWLHSQRCTDAYNYVDNKFYHTIYRNVVDKLLHTSFISVVCNPADPSHTYGFVVCDPTTSPFTLHYAYIKPTYRGFGLSSTLIRNIYPHYGTLPTTLTHIDRTHYTLKHGRVTRSSFFIHNRSRLLLTYNPLLLGTHGNTQAP